MLKLFATISVFAIFMIFIGYHIVYRIQRAQVRSEMKKKLRDSHKEYILEMTFEKTDAIEWEDEHEFLYGGEMYDVLEKKIVNGRMVVSCISDKMESQLLSAYQKQHDSNQEKNLVFKFISLLFTIPSFDLPAIPCMASLNDFSLYNTALYAAPDHITTPPPKRS